MADEWGPWFYIKWKHAVAKLNATQRGIYQGIITEIWISKGRLCHADFRWLPGAVGTSPKQFRRTFDELLAGKYLSLDEDGRIVQHFAKRLLEKRTSRGTDEGQLRDSRGTVGGSQPTTIEQNQQQDPPATRLDKSRIERKRSSSAKEVRPKAPPDARAQPCFEGIEGVEELPVERAVAYYNEAATRFPRWAVARALQGVRLARMKSILREHGLGEWERSVDGAAGDPFYHGKVRGWEHHKTTIGYLMIEAKLVGNIETPIDRMAHLSEAEKIDMVTEAVAETILRSKANGQLN